MKKGRDELQTHMCKRCYFAYDCIINECKHRVADGEVDTDGKCRFCRKLTDGQCARIRAPENHLKCHLGFAGKHAAKLRELIKDEM